MSSPAAALDPRDHGSRSRFVWRAVSVVVAAGLVVLGARYLINDAIPFLTDISSGKFGRFWPRRVWLLTHIAGSGLALLVGPFQFWSGLRQRSMLVHRWSGRLYVVGVLIGGSAAFYLASHAGQGAPFAISLGTLGVVWWSTTGMAYIAIRLGHVSQHKEWVLRSYVVTFTFVTTRTLAELGILPSLGRDPFSTLVWLSWSMPLLATEIVVQGRKVMARGLSGTTMISASVLVLLVGTVSAQRVDRLEGKNVSIAQTNFKGRSAIQVIAAPDAPNATSYAVVTDALFGDGSIEVDLAGQPAAGAGGGARGFIGIAFRLQADGRYEYIYLRPTNGRADDQVRRNHSTQYSSHPDFDFARSRQEAPEKYESYVDLEPGVWTKYRIEVEGRTARLYVHGAEQPCLIVDDLKLEPRAGGVALWVGPGTEGYFSNLKITVK